MLVSPLDSMLEVSICAEMRCFTALTLIQRKQARLGGELQATNEGIKHFNITIDTAVLIQYITIEGMAYWNDFQQEHLVLKYRRTMRFLYTSGVELVI